MPSIHQLTAAAVLLAVGAAVPSNLERRGGFRVEQVVNPNFKQLTPGPVQLYKAHAKFNKAGVPADIKAAATAAAAAISTGSVTAAPGDAYDSLYLSPVKVGSQTFKLDFDTGSSDLWVFGQSLKSSGGSHTYYTPGSTAAQSSGETWSITYGDGSSASGNVYRDTVNIGGTSVTGQEVENAQQASSQFLSDASDGLVGLAFDSISTCQPTACTTFFTNAIKAGLPQKLFTANLKYHTAGVYDFGYIDASQHTGSITYTPVLNTGSFKGFWGFTPSGYAIGSGSTVSAALSGIADTGTTLLYADPSVVSAYYRQVKGATNSNAAGGYIFPCSATLPSFSLIINGYKATVPGSYINYAPYQGSQCFGGIQVDTGIGFAIYGDIFLKSQFVVFDRSQSTPRLGFAPKP